jgi:hypothetical protein
MGYARIPNGTGDFIIKQATFGINNEIVLGVESSLLTSEIVFYPNPVNNILNIENKEGNITSIKAHSLLGQQLFSQSYSTSSLINIDLSSFSKGTYFFTINDSQVIKVLKN